MVRPRIERALGFDGRDHKAIQRATLGHRAAPGGVWHGSWVRRRPPPAVASRGSIPQTRPPAQSAARAAADPDSAQKTDGKSIWHHHHFIITSFDNHHVVLPWLCYHGVAVVSPQRTLAWEDICTRLLLRFACIQQRHYGLKVMASTLIKQRLIGLPKPSRRAETRWRRARSEGISHPLKRVESPVQCV